VSLVQRVNTAAQERLLRQLGIARAALTARIEHITPWNTLVLQGSIALIQITLLQIQTQLSALLGLIARREQLLQ
jgi:ACT domain-containing protein